MALSSEFKDGDSSQTYTIRFLVHNLHCNTCVSHATDVIQGVAPDASTRISIIDHMIEVERLSSRDIAPLLAERLANAGFDVEHVSILDANKYHVVSSLSRSNSLSYGHNLPLSLKVSNAEIRRKHRKNCDVCRDEDGFPHDGMLQWFTQFFKRKRGRPAKFRNDRKDLILSNDSEAGIGVLYSTPSQTANSPIDADDKNQPRTYEFIVSIEGMTCASCTHAVTEALEKIVDVQTVNVNLLANHAKVVFSGYESKTEEILEAIEDVGFEANAGELKSVSVRNSLMRPDHNDGDSAQERIIDVQISGIYCRKCPSMIITALQTTFPHNIQIVKPPSLDRPYMSIAYKVSRPAITVRRLIDFISNLDPAYAAAIYRPPSIEQRSFEISRQERKRVLRHLLLTLIIAIPSFVLGVVYMSLVPRENKTRQWLEKPIWAGTAMRMEWALFILTTPAYFYGGSLFHSKALKEIWSTWRPRSKIPILRRFYRFGSMNLLISAGTSVAYFASVAILGMDATSPVGSQYSNNDAKMRSSTTYFDTVTFLILFILAGKFLESYSKAKAGDAVASLNKLRPESALLMDDDTSKTNSHSGVSKSISVELLELGDLVSIPHGACPPSDGILEGGFTALFDESSLTGESKPVRKLNGDNIFTGSTNVSDPVTMKVTSIGTRSMLDQIIDAVREGQTKRAPVERLADILTGYFTPIITLIAIITWIVWLSLGISGVFPQSWLDVRQGGWPFWSLEFAVAVFVVACPCGIGLAAPTALFIGGGLAARKGILVQGGGQAFQEASQIDAIVLDKTGTLTEGRMQVVKDEFLNNYQNDQGSNLKIIAYSVARLLEGKSSHPIAKAVSDYCDLQLEGEPQLQIEMTEVKEIAGKGMSGKFYIHAPEFEERTMEAVIGNESLLVEAAAGGNNGNDNLILQSILPRLQSAGCSIAILATRAVTNGTGLATSRYQPTVVFAITDPIRTDALEVLNSLRDRGISVYMCTGDNSITARAIASQLAIPVSHVRAGVLPQEKAQFIRELQQPEDLLSGDNTTVKAKRRRMVAFAGDGTNDTPALAAADVSIAISHPTASDIALTTSSFILLHPNLTSILTLVTLSRRVFNRVKFNFFWAGIYNVILIPVAAGVFFFVGANWSEDSQIGHGGFRLSPVWAAAAMAGSSVSVVASSLALRWEDDIREWLPSRDAKAKEEAAAKEGSAEGIM